MTREELEHIPVVRVREGGGAENLFATLAISVANLKQRADAAEKRVRELEEALEQILTVRFDYDGYKVANIARTALGKEPRT